MSEVASFYGSEGWEFECLRARHFCHSSPILICRFCHFVLPSCLIEFRTFRATVESGGKYTSRIWLALTSVWPVIAAIWDVVQPTRASLITAVRRRSRYCRSALTPDISRTCANRWLKWSTLYGCPVASLTYLRASPRHCGNQLNQLSGCGYS